MEIKIDGNADTIRSSGEDALGAVMDKISGWTFANDRIILTLRLDGEDITAEFIAKNSLRKASEFKMLSVSTNSRSALAKGVLAETLGLLEDLEALQREAANSAIRGNEREAGEKTTLISEKWALVCEGLLNAPLLIGVNVSAPDAPQWAADIRSFFTALESTIFPRFKSAVDLRDFSLLADILLYELGRATDAAADAALLLAKTAGFELPAPKQKASAAAIPSKTAGKIRPDPALLKANLEALKTWNPAAAAAVESADFLPEEAVSTAKNGLPTLACKTRSGALRIHSEYDPEAEARIFLEEQEIGELDTIIMFGFGLGYQFLEISRKLSKENILIVIEEDARRLKQAFAIRDFAEILENPRLFLLVAEGFAAIGDVIRQGPEVFLKRIHWLVHPPSQRASPEYYKRARDEAQKAISAAAVTVRTAFGLARQSFMNALGNFEGYLRSPGIAPLEDRFKSYPGIVVSAGPSLAKNIEVLRELKGRAVIVAVATTFSILENRGIIPDFAVVLDYHHISKQHFQGAGAAGAPLVTDPKANPEAVQSYPGPKLFCENDVLRKIVGDVQPPKGGVAMGATVAHTAVSFLEYIGCDPIILVGQDFAFTDGLTHLPGTGIFNRWHGEINRFQSLEMKEQEILFRGGLGVKTEPDLNGNPVHTHDNLLSYRLDFEEMFKRMDRRILNATEGGLPIKGAENVRLAEIAETYREKPIPAELFSLETEYGGAEKTLPGIIERLKGFKSDGATLGDLYEKATAIIKRALNRVEKGKNADSLIRELHGLKKSFVKYDHVLFALLNLARSDFLRSREEDRSLRASNMKPLERQKAQARRDYEFLTGLYRAELFLRRRLETVIEGLERSRT